VSVTGKLIKASIDLHISTYDDLVWAVGRKARAWNEVLFKCLVLGALGPMGQRSLS